MRLLVLVILIGIIGSCSDKKSDILIISNLNDRTIDLPMELSLNNSERVLKATSIENPKNNFLLQKSIPFMNGINEVDSYSAILNKRLEEGKYIISASNYQTKFKMVETKKGRVTISENQIPILTYNYGMQLEEGVPEKYRRSAYIHPIYDLQGTILTDDFPKDHYHHRGLSWMWPKVFIDTVRYDLWHIYGQKGELDGIHQVFEKWLVKDVGPVCTVLGVKNIWQLDDNTKVLDEEVYIKIYKKVKNTRTVDIKLLFIPTKDIVLEGQTKKGYGGLNLRFAPRKNTEITSMYGIEKDSDLKEMPWADQTAIFGNNNYESGITIFQHKNNPKFPAGWCLRHYGFLGVAWPGTDKYFLKKGELLTLSFRLLIHNDNTSQNKINDVYDLYNNVDKINFNSN